MAADGPAWTTKSKDRHLNSNSRQLRGHDNLVPLLEMNAANNAAASSSSSSGGGNSNGHNERESSDTLQSFRSGSERSLSFYWDSTATSRPRNSGNLASGLTNGHDSSGYLSLECVANPDDIQGRLPSQDAPLPPTTAVRPTSYDEVLSSGDVYRLARTRSLLRLSLTSSAWPFHGTSAVGSHPQPSRKGCCVHNCCLTTSVLIAFVLAMGALIFTLFVLLTADPESEEYCTPCSLLTMPPENSTNHDHEYQVSTKIINGMELCCVNSSNSLSLLVSEIQRNERESFAMSQEITLAHVGLFADKTTSDGKKVLEGTHYKLKVARNPRHYNVFVGKDYLRVRTAGWYFVYSSLHFNSGQMKKVCKPGDVRTWIHQVYMDREVYRKGKLIYKTAGLLRGEQTCCTDCDQYRTTAFTGGVFELNPNDVIFVDVNVPPLVMDDHETSYLGLFLMNGKD